MRALPVDNVRALMAIVDCRGFTRAAQRLGRSQPTVSLQIRRLEELIGGPVFDDTARLTLSARGSAALEYGRRFVAAHDDMVSGLERLERRPQPVRLGMPSEFAALLAPSLVNLAHARGDSFCFELTCESSETLIGQVRANRLDVALAMTADGKAEGSTARWRMPLSWIAAPRLALSEGAPLRLVTPPEGALFHTIATEALARAGRRFDIVCKSDSADVLRSAVDAGYGVALAPTLLAPKSARLPPEALPAPLPDVTLGLYAREGAGSSEPLLAPLIDLLVASPALAA